MVLATVLVLASAALHAGWNLAAKTSADRAAALWGQFLAGGVLGLPVLVIGGLPERAAWLPLLGSVLVHQVYCWGLERAYNVGDFSLAYPLARGGGAVGAALIGAVVLGDRLPPLGWVAVVVVLVGLLWLVDRASLFGGGRRSGTRAALAYSGLTAASIAVYSVFDAAGARRSTGLAYAPTLYLLIGVGLTVSLAARGRLGAAAARFPTDRWRWVGSGGASVGAYLLVNEAVRHAPVGYVSTLRESSVVFGAAAGWLVLGESMGQRRLMASVVILVGMVLLVVAAHGVG